MTSRFAPRLLLRTHHFAYLRAVVEGVDVDQAARLYLGVQHGGEVAAKHRLIVEQARALARRAGDARWRLIGIRIVDAPGAEVTAPPIDEWAEAEGLGDWSHDELQALYEERFGSSAAQPDASRRQHRNARLRARRLELLRELEVAAPASALPTDRLDGWLPTQIAEQLNRVGDLTLGDLQRRIKRGGRWWRVLQAFGEAKARGLASLVDEQLGSVAPVPVWPVATAAANRQRLSGAQGRNRYRGDGALDAANDAAAVGRWIAVRAGSKHTAKQYLREAERFVLFCVLERQRALSDVDDVDCRAYMDFLQAIPERWISRNKVPRMTSGWAPFMGPLSIASQRVAIKDVSSMFGWLVKARYLQADPWGLINRKVADDPDNDDDVTSRAFTPEAWAALMIALDATPSTPSTARLRWICLFAHAVGLRASELLAARRSHLKEQSFGWTIRVHGKGGRNRTVPVPASAMAATRKYFDARGLSFDQAEPNTPLLASLRDTGPISYTALSQTFNAFVQRAIDASSLPLNARIAAHRASAHWLRHTYATRAAERGMPPDVLQANLGQSDPRTTAHYYRAQLERRQKAAEAAFPDTQVTSELPAGCT